jgi:hypothetical protein
LSPEHWKEYEALLRDRRMTVKTLLAWLRERGYEVGYASVARHRAVFDEDLREVRRTAMLAEHFADASRGNAGGAMTLLSDATVARFQQVLLERLMRLSAEGDEAGGATADATGPAGGAAAGAAGKGAVGARTSRRLSNREWLELARTIDVAVRSRRSLETLRAEFEDRARRAAEAAAKAAPKKPFDGAAVADKVRRILGIPPEEMPPSGDNPARSTDVPFGTPGLN